MDAFGISLFDNPQDPPRQPARGVRPADLRLHTSAETLALSGALTNHQPERWNVSPSRGGHVYRHPYGGGEVVVEHEPGETPEEVWTGLIMRQGLDSLFTIAYCLTVLIPQVPIPAGASLRARVDLYDVATSCGMLTSRRKEDALSAVVRVWSHLQAGERYVVYHTKTYREKRKTVTDHMASSVWKMNDGKLLGHPGLPANLPLFDEEGNPVRLPPRSVELLLSTEWAERLAKPEMRQFVTGVRALAAIPGGKTAGAIARAVGLRVLTIGRMYAHRGFTTADMMAAIQGEELRHLPAASRRRWITEYGGPDPDLVDPRSRRKYQGAYRAALGILTERERGIVAKAGDAAVGQDLTEGCWWDAWLDEEVRLVPGAAYMDQFRRIAGDVGVVASDRIATIFLQSRGRPRKTVPQVRKGGPGILLTTADTTDATADANA